MTHPLFSLAAQRAERRNRRAITELDPHIARDLGLPYRHRPKLWAELW